MMSLNNQEDDFIADDFEPEIQDDFVEDDFEPEVSKENEKTKKLEDLNWLEKHFTSEGNKLQAEENRNFLKGIGSGLSAGFSELVPGLEVEESGKSTLGKVIGSVAPIGAAAKAITTPLKAAASLSPKFIKPLQSLANLLGLSAAGGLYEGLEESAEKSLEEGEFIPPSPQTIVEQGGKWAALDVALRSLGFAGRFAKALYNKSSKLGISATELIDQVANEVGTKGKVAEKALSILEDKPLQQIEKEVKGLEKTEAISGKEFQEKIDKRSYELRNRKIDKQDFSKLENESIPKSYLPAEFEAEEIAEQVISEDLNNRIESVSQRASTEKELGENIRNDIERSVKSKKAETDALYQIAKEVETTSQPSVKRTADAIVEQLKKIEAGGLSLTPEGYNRAESQLRKTLTDLGYGLQQDANGLIVNAIESAKKPLSQLVEVKRRLNNIINYDLIDTSAQDFLKGPVEELRKEIRVGYGNKDSKARKAFEMAEKEFGEFAEKKGKKSIRSLRTTEKPESIAKIVRTPSGLADVKDVVSKEQFSQIERELLEYLRGQKEEKAASFYREIRPSLSSDSRSIAEEIIESKAPAPTASRKIAQRESIQKKAIDDIAKATITGERPQVALDLWKTVEGQQLIKNTLENNPNKKEVLKYLQDQSFKDFYTSIISPDGVIDFKKLDKMLEDKATKNNIRMIAGEDGVNFLKNLENLSNRIKKNKTIIEGKIDKGSAKERESIRKEIEKHGKERFNKSKDKRLKESDLQKKSSLLYKFDDLVSSYGLKGKGVLAALGIWNIGAVEGIGIAVSYEIFSRLAKNKSVQNAIKKAALPNSSPAALVRSLISIEEEADKD